MGKNRKKAKKVIEIYRATQETNEGTGLLNSGTEMVFDTDTVQKIAANVIDLFEQSNPFSWGRYLPASLLIPLVNNTVYVVLKNFLPEDHYANKNAQFFSTVSGILTMGIVNKISGATNNAGFVPSHFKAALMAGGLGGMTNAIAGLAKVDMQTHAKLLGYVGNAVTSVAQVGFFGLEAYDANIKMAAAKFKQQSKTAKMGAGA